MEKSKMEPEGVIIDVQKDAAETVATEVSTTVALTAGAVASEVVEVSDQLAEHAEASEERHEEILEGQEWLENQFQIQRSQLELFQTATTTMLNSLTTQLLAAITLLQNPNPNPNPPLLEDSNQLILPMSETEVEVVVPESDAVDLPVATTVPAKRKHKLI
jgi:hypothetical protein